MSTLPMPAAPAAAPAQTGEPQVADSSHAHDPAFAAALTAALASRSRGQGAGPLRDGAELTGMEAAAAAPDLVYHVHTASDTTPPQASPGADHTSHASHTPHSSHSSHSSQGAPVRSEARTGNEVDPRAVSEPASVVATSARAAAGRQGDGALTAAARADRPDHARRSSDVATRDTALLQPEFRARLDRVITRLESMGHTVEVIETYRDQARQDHLYAQGRSRPGSVVTWTRHSNHTQGRAADLLIDGSFEPSAGYTRLAQVAAEEGLRTLGAKDPGHVELPGGSRSQHAHSAMHAHGADAAGIVRVAAPAAPAALASVAAIAAPAAPAALAAPAAVAAVAAAAVPGSSFAGHRSDATAARVASAGEKAALRQTNSPVDGSRPEAAILPTSVRAAAAAGTSVRSASADEPTLREAHAAVQSPDAPVAATSEHTGYSTQGEQAGAASVAPQPASGSAAGAARAQPVGHVADADIASRVARVLQLQADAAAQPLTRVTLRLGEEAGETGRIRIDLRGGTVATAIDLADPVRAAELRSRVHELETALQQRGLETARLSVRSTAEANAAAALLAATRPAGAAAPAALAHQPHVPQQLVHTNDRDPGNGRQQPDREPRQQQRQEAK